MTVGQLLGTISARELTDWQAYEQEYGMLGKEYERMLLREIHYMQQAQRYDFGSVNTEKGKKNPVQEPKRLPSAHEMFDLAAESQSEDAEE